MPFIGTFALHFFGCK